MAGIYIHIPFCKQACHYCDFHFSTNTSLRTEMVQAIARELELQHNYLGGELVKTIYFGGGTPSLLHESELKLLLGSIKKLFDVQQDSEITIEVNPDDVDENKFNMFLASGINRLSIGIQSFNDDVLKFLNRPHDAACALNSFALARKSGFNNISLDLIYAIPGQDFTIWEKNIQQAIELRPEHISAYSLTIEQKTAFGNWFAKGKLTPVNEDTSALQFEILIEKLEQAGYEHYEISNFCNPGFHSRHNSNYWKQEKYLGVGPSAHSYDGQTRQSNVSNNNLYIKAIHEHSVPCEHEILTRKDHVNEYLLTSLRTIWGCDIKKLDHDYQYDLWEVHGSYLNQLLVNRLAILENDHLKLSKTGRLVADRISSDLFLTS